MKSKILTMLDLQDAMNRKVNPQWRAADYPWYRAIWTECAEMLDHYGWKWWKHQKPDMEQVRLEIVDIWHFALSAQLMKGAPLEQTAERILEDLSRPAELPDIRAAIEALAQDAIETRDADIGIFAALLHSTRAWTSMGCTRATSARTCSTSSARTMATRTAPTRRRGTAGKTTSTWPRFSPPWMPTVPVSRIMSTSGWRRPTRRSLRKAYPVFGDVLLDSS